MATALAILPLRGAAGDAGLVASAGAAFATAGRALAGAGAGEGFFATAFLPATGAFFAALAGALVTATFLTGAFFAGVLPVAALLAFLTTAGLLAADFAGAFLAGAAFLVAVFFTATFLTVLFFAGAFLATAFFATAFDGVADFFAAALPDVLAVPRAAPAAGFAFAAVADFAGAAGLFFCAFLAVELRVVFAISLHRFGRGGRVL